MQDTDLKIFSGLMVTMGEAYAKELSGMLIEIYWQCLKCFELSEVREAFKAHLRNPEVGQFFPKPADLIRLIEGPAEARALGAWTEVQWVIGAVGSYESVAFDDPLIHAVIEGMGGWIELCAMTLKDLDFKALDFQKRYRALLHQSPKRYPAYLAGIIERDNAKEGYDFPPPVLVGDLRKAEAVVASGSQKSALIHRPSVHSVQKLIQRISAVQRKPEGHHE